MNIYWIIFYCRIISRISKSFFVLTVNYGKKVFDQQVTFNYHAHIWPLVTRFGVFGNFRAFKGMLGPIRDCWPTLQNFFQNLINISNNIFTKFIPDSDLGGLVYLLCMLRTPLNARKLPKTLYGHKWPDMPIPVRSRSKSLGVKMVTLKMTG